MKIIGHRGAMAYKPENTLSSFEEALRFGVDGAFTNYPDRMREWVAKYTPVR